MADQEKALRILMKAGEALTLIQQLLQNAKIYDSCYAVRIRIKNEDRLLQKVDRKIKEKPGYSIHDVTDVIGIRLITLFRSDILPVLEKVLDLIEHETPVNPNPFKKKRVDEILVYSTEGPGSVFNQGLSRLLIQRNYSNHEIKNMDEGYSSVHIVCRVDEGITNCATISVNYSLPIEIQIRTVFEDAWGEIDHKYGYSRRSGKIDPSEGTINVDPHLKALKRFTDACSTYADAIKDDADVKLKVAEHGKVLPHSRVSDTIQSLFATHLKDEYVNLYVKIQEKRNNIASEIINPKGLTSAYLECYEDFINLLEQVNTDEAVTEHAKKLFEYHVLLSATLCLFLTADEKFLLWASSNYEQIVKDHPNSPMAKMRLGQSYLKLKKIEDSILLFSSTWESVKRAKESQAWSAYFTESDYKIISGVLPKLLGFAHWSKYEINKAKSRRIHTYISSLEKAYVVTKEGYSLKKLEMTDSEIGDLSLENNLLYYGVEYLISGIANQFTEQIKTEIAQIASSIMSRCERHNDSLDLDTLDTILRYLIFTKDRVSLKYWLGRLHDIPNLHPSNITNDFLKTLDQASALIA